MHSVSPVRVRSESLYPMTACSFEDAFVNKAKKRVQIGPSTFFKEQKKPNNIHQAKITSVKPRQINRLNKKPQETNQGEYDQIPIKEVPFRKQKSLSNANLKSPAKMNMAKRIISSGFSTCTEPRSRSDSKTSEKSHSSRASQADLSINGSSQDSQIFDYSCNDSHNRNGLFPPNRRVYSLSPIRPVWSQCSDYHPIPPNPYMNPNLTYTMNRSRSCDSSIRDNTFRSIKPIHEGFESKPSESNNREGLCKKLHVTEEIVNEIACQLNMVKDYLLLNSCPQMLNENTIIYLEKERDRLIENLDVFEARNMDLKDTLYAIGSPSVMSNFKLMEENNLLAEKIEALQIERNKYKNMLMELETNIYRTGSTNEALNFENNALCNIKSSLEENRAHLRRQLISRESELSRMSVQVKNLSKKLEQSQSEIEMLRAGRQSTIKQTTATSGSENHDLNKKNSNKNIYNHSKNVKLVKHYFNLEEILANPEKTRLYIDKLNGQINERNTSIENLSTELAKIKQKLNSNLTSGLDSDDRTVTTTSSTLANKEQKSARFEKHQAEKLRKENEKLKNQVQVKEEKLKSSDVRIKSLEKKLSKLMSASNQSNIQETHFKSKQQASDQQTSSSTSIDEETPKLSNENSENNNVLETSQIQRTKNFNEQELNSVRSRLQERLNELEPLPELLKNNELKLHDALIKLKNFEIESLEARRTINQLHHELETAHVNNKNLLDKLKESTNLKSQEKKLKAESKATSENHSTNFQTSVSTSIELKHMEESTKRKLLENLRTSKLDPIEKRIQEIEYENRELNRQIGVKEEMIRELSSKLAIKTNEASSFSRQLDMAMSDGKLKEQQLKEKIVTKERQWTEKCSELETKLSSLQFFNKADKRDKEELTQDYSIQVKDLKARLDQATLTNKQMQDYVNFLKNSYISYFNENTFDSYEYGVGNRHSHLSAQNNLF